MKIKFASSPRIPESDKVALAVFLYLTSFSSLFRVFFICRCRMTYNQYDVKLCTDLKYVIYRTGGPCRSGEMLPKVLSVRTDRGRRKRLRSVHAVKTGGNISKFLARLLEGSITWENTALQPTDVGLTTYITMIRPLLEYSSPVKGGLPSFLADELDNYGCEFSWTYADVYSLKLYVRKRPIFGRASALAFRTLSLFA